MELSVRYRCPYCQGDGLAVRHWLACNQRDRNAMKRLSERHPDALSTTDSCTAAIAQRFDRPSGSRPLARRSALRIDQHSRVEHALRIEFSFYCLKRGREQRRALTVVPGPMIAANRVMMRDRTTRLDQRVAGRSLDRL